MVREYDVQSKELRLLTITRPMIFGREMEDETPKRSDCLIGPASG